MSAGLESSQSHAGDRAALRVGVPAALFAGAAVGWWWSVRTADDMQMSDSAGMDMGMDMTTESAMSAGAFMAAWLAMMAAMMLPAITPVVKLYARASAQQRVAPVPYFVAGYLVVWTLLGVPAYFAWRELEMPLAEGADWAARLAGGAFIAAGLWQLTPLKNVCLRHCRSPISFFLRQGNGIARPAGALKAGAAHGLFCVGCCWAIFAVLVAIGTMHIGWMLALTALIVIEKTTRPGERVAIAAGVGFAVLGVALLVAPGTLGTIT